MKNMKISAQDIIQICLEERTSFSDVIMGFNHEIKGLLNSEMLLFCAMSKYLNISDVIESGRARGNSTEILARYFRCIPSVSIKSVEFLKYTEDALIAMVRLYGRYTNLTLLFGNANELLPQLCSSVTSCTVLIDGPKGPNALQLAAFLLKNPNVKAVFIHDSHQDADNIRPAIGKVFSHAFYSSDHPDFVNAFSDLDGPCWDVYKNWAGYEDWGPYKRGDKKMKSYGPTLTMIMNTEEGMDREKEVSEITKLRPVRPGNKSMIMLRRMRWQMPRDISQILYFFKYYSKLFKYH